MKRFAVIALLLAVATGCATSPTGRSQLMLISPEAAIVESKKAYLSTVSELDAENKLVDDPKLADKVAVITGRLVTEAIAMYPNLINLIKQSMTRAVNWQQSIDNLATTVQASPVPQQTTVQAPILVNERGPVSS